MVWVLGRFTTSSLLLAIALLAGCSSTNTPAAAAVPTSAPPPSSRPISSDDAHAVDSAFIASGPITVENQVDVTAQREGIVAALMGDAGISVRKGQLLARLDDRQLSAERDAAKAQLESIDADLRNWEATVKVSQADLDRTEKMWAANLITREQLDHDRFKLVANQYELDREQKNYQRQLNVLKSFELELQKTEITAPFDGVVARRYIRDGQHVVIGDKLFWVTAIAPLIVKFTVPEKYAAQVQRGAEIHVVAASLPDQPHSAKVTSVSPVVDPSSGTVDVTALLAGQPGELRPGMMVNIALQAGK